MSDPYVGEIRLFAGNFAPAGWAFCHGQLLAISEHDTLFSLIGTTYGGDGTTTFALPDLRGRLALHQGHGAGGVDRPIGAAVGQETVTLTTAQLPAHTHPVAARSATGDRSGPAGNLLASSANVVLHLEGPPDTSMGAGAITGTGGSQPHSNLGPALAVSYIVSLYGIYPSPS